MSTFSQNLHHLSPKGKCTTLASNRSHNGHPMLFSSWHPVPVSLHPDSSPTNPPPHPGADLVSPQLLMGPRVTQRVKPAGRPRRITAIPRLRVAPRSSLASRVSAAQPTPPFHSRALWLSGLTVWFDPE